MVRTYSGKDVGKYIEPALEKAKKRIIVISPWISKKYLELLVQKAKEGAKVVIVTSTKNRDLKRIESICGSRSNIANSLVLLSLALALLLYSELQWVLEPVRSVLAFLPLVASLWYALRKSASRERFPLEIYVVDDSHFVHSKIYVFDDVVITGSANLTQSGLWKNTESIVIFPKGQQKSVINDARKIINKAKKEATLSINCLED